MSQEHFSLLPYCKGPSEIVPEVIAEDSVHEQFSKHVTLAEDELRQFGSIDGYTKRAVDEYLLEEDDDDYNDYEE